MSESYEKQLDRLIDTLNDVQATLYKIELQLKEISNKMPFPT